MHSRNIACIYCRQMKLGCDAKALFPAPCSRCTKHSLKCVVDPSFRRTAKRRKLRELEQELEKIKALDRIGQHPPSPSLQTSAAQLSHPSPSTVSSETKPSPVQARQIGDISITAEALQEILRHFYNTYHPSFPVAADHDDFLNVWDQDHFLLWTMTAIASKSMDQYSTYNSLLEPHVRRMAADIYSFQNSPLQTVQALLLLCWWPFTFAASMDDPSWTYCALAGHIALQHGFHRPEHQGDFMYAGGSGAHRVMMYQRAWAGCGIVNQTLSSQQGIPATVRPRRVSSNILPSVLEQLLKIACQSYHICQSLGDCDGTSSGLLPNALTTVTAIEPHLNFLESELRDASDSSVEIALLRTKLQLFSFVLSVDPNGATGDAEAAILLAKASTAAVDLIHIAAERVTQKFWPTIVRGSVFYAVNFLLYLSTLPGHENQSVVRNAIGEAWRLGQSKSEFEHDSPSRWSKIVEYLSRVYSERGHTYPPSLSVRSRMAANVLYENVWRAKERFSQHVRQAAPADYTTAAALEDMTNLESTNFLFDQSFLDSFDMTEASNWFAEL